MNKYDKYDTANTLLARGSNAASIFYSYGRIVHAQRARKLRRKGLRVKPVIGGTGRGKARYLWIPGAR